MSTKKNNVGTKKENMKAKKNNGGSKKVSREFKNLIAKVKEVYKETLAQEEKQGKKLFDLGKLLSDLREQNDQNKYYSSFEALCRDEFAFSRQYGYRMIKFYKVQNELHESKALEAKKYLSNSMLVTLIRAKDPVKVWKTACKKAKGSSPTEALISQIIDQKSSKTKSNDDSSSLISTASAGNIIHVLQVVKKEKYLPDEKEQRKLIKLLKESWELNGQVEDEDAQSDETEEE